MNIICSPDRALLGSGLISLRTVGFLWWFTEQKRVESLTSISRTLGKRLVLPALPALPAFFPRLDSRVSCHKHCLSLFLSETLASSISAHHTGLIAILILKFLATWIQSFKSHFNPHLGSLDLVST